MSKNSDTEIVGRVVGLWRYPVKSMGAEVLDEAEISWNGITGDRRWAFVRNNIPDSGFPWLTLRERNDMNHYIPVYAYPAKPESSATIVKTPSGEKLNITDPELSTELWPEGARVIRQHRGIFDTFPLSLITTQSINRISEITGESLDVSRFRPNILVDANDNSEFPEDAWVGRVLRIGEMRMRIDKRDGRCVVITIDPYTQKSNPVILRAVAKERQGCLGVYGTTVDPGSVSVNDEVLLESGQSG